MPNKKIVFLTRPIGPPWDEASKNFAFYLARQVKIPFVEFTLLTTKETITEIPPYIKQDSIHTTKALTLFSKLRLFWYLWHSDADCIHSISVFTPATGLVIKFIIWVRQFKVIQTISSLSPTNFFIPYANFGDITVCFSQATAKKLKRYNIIAEVIPPGIPVDVFRPKQKENIIAFLGELYRQQSFDIVVPLVDTLLRLLPNYTIILGFRTTRKPAQEAILVTQLKKRWANNASVRFTNIIYDMPAFLAKTKLVIFPATHVTEKFDYPLVLLEALSSGTPIIVSNIGPLRELATLPGAATPTSNSPGEFYEIIIQTLKKFSTRSAEARKTAIQNFDIQKAAKRYEAIYKKLLFEK